MSAAATMEHEPGSDDLGSVGRPSPIDAPAALTAAEHFLLGAVRRHGIMPFVVFVTFCITSFSTVITLSALWLTVEDFELAVVPGLVLGALVPLLVAPPALLLLVRLTARLDEAGAILQRAATTDPLTGLLNRRGFFERIEQLGPGHGALVVMVDLDDFKPLNDTHGHATGDLALQRVAQWLSELGGESGIVARMGGDEFALVVDLVCELPQRQSLVADGVAFSVTIGCTKVPDVAAIDEALNAADADLYARKAQRR